MTRFQNRVLGSIDAIYRLVGGDRGVSEIDLSSPIIRVHDVAPAASLSSGFLAMHFAEHTVATGNLGHQSLSADDLLAKSSVDAEMARRGLRRDNSECWCLDLGVSVAVADIANFESAKTGVEMAHVPGGAYQRLTRYYNSLGEASQEYSPFAAAAAYIPAQTGTSAHANQGFPVPMGDPTVAGTSSVFWAIRTGVTGLGYAVQGLFWIGPEGVQPPRVF